MGEVLLAIKNYYEKSCSSTECIDVLLPREREAVRDYVSTEFLDRRTMEIVRCLVQNMLKNKKDKSIKQFLYLPRQALTGRLNPQRNLLTDIQNYEKYGIDMVVSDAKIMGSIATILRCAITEFTMETIRKLLNETTWRLNASFNQVQQQEMDSLLSVFHNYIVGILCANPTRSWSPNVVYTYGLYASQCPQSLRKNFCTMVEKVPCLPQQNNLMVFLKNGRMTPDMFLSVFYQLAFTLEIMQSQYGYCNFDLNTENILVRPIYQQSGNGVSWTYMMYGNQYVLSHIQFFATMSDYQKSCFNQTLMETGILSMEDQFIGMGKFEKYGIMDFMVPGYDMFVFLQSVRAVIVNTLDPNSKHFVVDPYSQENNLRILNFINHVLKEFFQLSPTYMDMDAKTKANYRYYNVLLCKGVALTPLAVVEKVMQSGIISSILETKDPVDVSRRNAYLPPISKKKVPLFLTDLLPTWKTIIDNQEVVPELGWEDISVSLDTLLNMIQNKQVLFEFDVRPLMTNGLIEMETIDYYDKLVFNPNGYYHGYYQNTLLFYNTLMTFLNNYYYKYYIQEKDYIEKFVENNDKITFLFKYIGKPQFVSKIAGIVRFCQTIVNLKIAKERNFCCIKRKETLGNMAAHKQQNQQIYKVRSEQQTTQCGKKQQTKKQQKQQQTKQQRKQQSVLPVPQQRKQQAVAPVPPTTQQRKQQTVVVVPPVPQQRKQQAVAPVPPTTQQRKQQTVVAVAPVLPTTQQRKQQTVVAPSSSSFSFF
jgi:hypothetical protein